MHGRRWRRTRLPFEAQSPVVTITTLVDRGGGRVDWGPQGIVHGRKGSDGKMDLYTMGPRGGNVVSLTDGKLGLDGHNDQPTVHPSGLIVFQAEDTLLPWLGRPEDKDYATQGGAGYHNKLMVADSTGSTFTLLRPVVSGEAHLHPHFNADGTQLTYAHCIPGLGWEMVVADFQLSPPALLNARSYRPNARPGVFYETHGLKDGLLLYTSNSAGTKEFDYDIWTLDTTTQVATNLTNSPDVWDEHGHKSPGGTAIVWACSEGHTVDMTSRAGWQGTLATDLKLMDADGGDKRQLTYFNTPGHPHYAGGRAIVADNAWSPDGRSIVAVVMVEGVGNRIVKIDLDRAY